MRDASLRHVLNAASSTGRRRSPPDANPGWSRLRRAAGCAALTAALLGPVMAASAHDIWINRMRMTNKAGEWCCGAHDCGKLASHAVKAGPAGYVVHGNATIIGPDGPEDSYRIDETVPYSETQPSPDGAYWQCKRPDGSRRCFFAPPKGS